MNTITRLKPIEEIAGALNGSKSVYIIGCGTCATMLHTGGKAEVLEMKKVLTEMGKEVTGWMVIPTVCDDMTAEALKQEREAVGKADSILVMSCAFGVQTVRMASESKAVNPALNTLFVGKEDSPGHFIDVCAQCGNCVLATTAGICPVVRCAKSLFNGPCGGSVAGKCEVSKQTPCAWQLIYDRLAKLGQLSKLEEVAPPRDWSSSLSGGPREITVR